MKKIFLHILALWIICSGGTWNSALGFNIVYPKSDNVVIDSPRTFFIGNEKPDLPLKINDEHVEIHHSGGFWHTVNLNIGENIFTIDNGETTATYKITRPEPKHENEEDNKTVHYNSETSFIVETQKDNTPLRSTPVDGGMNRLVHLQRGHQLEIIGEYRQFYKVRLSRDDYAWIAKKDVYKIPEKTIPKAKIIGYIYDETKNSRIFTLQLTQKVPYTLYEYHGLDLTVYNVDGMPYNKYEFHIHNTGKNFGYKSYFTEDNKLVIEVKNPPVINKEKPLTGIKITIDPGHGGYEYGAIGCLGDKEKDINLRISKILADKLKQAGAQVYMTRNGDYDVDLYDRVKISQKNDSDIFISIHNNALPDIKANLKSSGTEVYYFYYQSKELAKTILKYICAEAGTKDNGAKAQSFAVIRNSESLSILLELAYMINPEGNWRLRDRSFENKAADAILHGLEKYLHDLQ